MKRLRDLSLTQLIYFARCAELSSMTEAAASLHVAQSAISTSIGNLEKRLGTPLFVRRRAKGLVLTAAGETFLARTRKILANLDDAVSEIDPSNVRGVLRVGVFPTLAPFYVPEIAQRLAQAHPGVELELVELGAAETDPALHSHSIEVALTYDLGLSVETQREVLHRASLYVAVSPNHRLANRDRVGIAELASEPMVLLDHPHSRDYFTETFTQAGMTLTVRHRFASFETVRAMVARGHGFTLLNQRPVHDLTYDGGRLAIIQLEEDTRSLDILLASAEPIDSLSGRVGAFVEQCRTVVREVSGAPVNE